MEGERGNIFFLKLSKELSKDYLNLSIEFKHNGFTVIPVQLKTLLEQTKKHKRIDLVILIRNTQEYKYYMKHVRHNLKYFIRNGKVNMFVAASFLNVNDAALMRKDQYFFVKLPVKTADFCEMVADTLELKDRHSLRWPGGVVPRMTLSS